MPIQTHMSHCLEVTKVGLTRKIVYAVVHKI